MEAVLAPEYTREIILEKAWACTIMDRKKTSVIIGELTKHFPVPQWLHLKRVKGAQIKGDSLTVLVCPHEDHHRLDESLRGLCPAFDIPPDSLGPLFKVEVPKHPPLTRKQFEIGSQHWPITFHEDKYISRLVSGDILNDKELKQAQSYMASAFQAAKKVSSEQKLDGCADGCTVVDPVKNCLLATSCSVIKTHPLHHAVMVAIDVVARQQGGGVYQFSENSTFMDETVIADASVNKTGPYLCTGYDMYLTMEPCVMCAMALVHSRIRRVIYAKPCTDGALGSKYMIHTQTGLNHHFEVFKGLLPESENAESENITESLT